MAKKRKSKKSRSKTNHFFRHHLFHRPKRGGLLLFMLLFAAFGAYYVNDIQAGAGVPVEVRAKGDTGEERVQLKINEQVVSTWTLSREYKTYSHIHDQTINDKDVKVVFVNDGRSSTGQDKNIQVDLVRVNGNTFQTEDSTVYSKGSWTRSNGCGPGYKTSERIHCNGYFQYAIGSSGVLKSESATVNVRVRSKGSTGEERVELRVGNNVVKSWTADRTYSTEVYTHHETIGDRGIKVAFVNDGRSSANADKNLQVDFIEVNGQRFESEASNVFSTGTWSRSNGCGDGNKSSEDLHCNGFFQYSIGNAGQAAPAPEEEEQDRDLGKDPIVEEVPQGSRVSVRMHGSTGQESVELHINDEAVTRWTPTTAMTSFPYTHTETVNIEDVRVAFVNDGRTAANEDKNVRIDSITIDNDVYQTEDSSTYSTGTYSRETGCAPGNKRSEWLHCNGYVQFVGGGNENPELPVIPPPQPLPLPETEPEPNPEPTPTPDPEPTPTPTPTPPPQTGGVIDGRTYIASTSNTDIPVYDTAWQFFALGTPTQADQYFNTLKNYGFTGAWAGILHHDPASLFRNYNGGGPLGSIQNGNIVLSQGYINRVNSMMDMADKHGMKLGLVIAWQNSYFPGGEGGPTNVSGILNASNACAYGRQMVQAFGNHPALSMWVMGGDAGSNNTNANKAIWGTMAGCMKSAGTQIKFNHHLPTRNYGGHFNYTDAAWLDMIAPETGHVQNAATTEWHLRDVVNAYSVPTWQGEARYFGINYDWIPSAYRNPGLTEMVADARAARNAGVSGYVYGNGGRWGWCTSRTTQACNPNNIQATFGAPEREVLKIFGN
jgi:hypothetical protein